MLLFVLILNNSFIFIFIISKTSLLLRKKKGCIRKIFDTSLFNGMTAPPVAAGYDFITANTLNGY